jgi:hypothetical protein
MTYSFFSIEIMSESESLSDLSGLASQGPVKDTAAKLLNIQDASFKLLVLCSRPIERIAPLLTAWSVHYLHTV